MSTEANDIELYKFYVEMADRISARRATANSFLLAVNTFLLSFLGMVGNMQGLAQSLWLYCVPAAGILICLTWVILIESYRTLNSAKFKVIHEMESQMAYAPFTKEWEYAKGGDGVVHKPISKVEPYIPYAFMALYIVAAAIALCSHG